MAKIKRSNNALQNTRTQNTKDCTTRTHKALFDLFILAIVLPVLLWMVSSRAKDYEIGICCFSAKHTALMGKSKDWLARNPNNVSTWDDMLTWYLQTRLVLILITHLVSSNFIVFSVLWFTALITALVSSNYIVMTWKIFHFLVNTKGVIKILKSLKKYRQHNG
jgi:hypothetical protein